MIKDTRVVFPLLLLGLVWLGVIGVQGVFLIGYSTSVSVGNLCVATFISDQPWTNPPVCISHRPHDIVLPSSTIDRASETFFITFRNPMYQMSLGRFNSTSDLYLGQLPLQGDGGQMGFLAYGIQWDSITGTLFGMALGPNIPLSFVAINPRSGATHFYQQFPDIGLNDVMSAAIDTVNRKYYTLHTDLSTIWFLMCVTDISNIDSIKVVCKTPVNDNIRFLGVGSDGTLYGEDPAGFNSINPTTGEVTRFAKFDRPYDRGSGTLDTTHNQLYLWGYDIIHNSALLLQYDLNSMQFVQTRNITSNGLYFGMQYQ